MATIVGGPKQSFLGFMFYNRFWFDHDLFGLTLGGGKINNPGRYLVLLPPINGESAITASTNSPYFTENPGTRSRPGTHPSRLTTCQSSTSPSAGSTTIAMRMCRTGLAVVASRLRAAIPELPRITFAITASPPGRNCWDLQRLFAPAHNRVRAMGFRIFGGMSHLFMSILVNF